MPKKAMIVAFVVSILAVGTVVPAAAWPDYDKIEELERNEANGGPRIVGGRSPYQSRFKLCNELPTPVHDKTTSQRKTVMKTVCWYE